MMEVKSDYKMTELGKIPVEWDLKKIGEICTFSQGLQVPVEEQYDDDGDDKVQFLRIVDYTQNNAQPRYIKKTEKKYFISKEDLIMIRYGNPGFVGIGREGVIANNMFKIIPEFGNITTRYLYIYLSQKNIKLKIKKMSTSTTMPAISFKTIADLPIVIPTINEQQKIAEILSTVDEQIEQTDQLIEKTKELKKGFMQQLLTKGIGHTEFKQSELGEIPVEWEVSSLDSVLDIRDGTHDSPNYVKNGIPFLTSKNLGKGKLNFKEVNYITEEDHKKFSERSLVENGDILFGMIGTVGNPVIVDLPYSISIKNVALVKFHESNMNNKYVLEYLNSQNTIKQFKKESNGGVQKFIALGKIRKLKITVPSVKEQQKIADILSSVDEDIEGYEEEKAKYDELKNGLMQQLLTGKTRVKVD